MKLVKTLALCGLTIGLTGCDTSPPTPQSTPSAPATTAAADAPASASSSVSTPAVAPPDQVFWGDTHLHTSDSADAFAFGARLGAEQALRFARGEQVTATSGMQAQLKRPLDFLVIADHAVGLGIGQEIYDRNPVLMADPVIARWSDMIRSGGEASQTATREIITGHSAGTNPPTLSDPKLVGPIVKGIWQARGNMVERYNQPGQFTAFIGYEFTPAPGGDNLHRVVIFRDGVDKTNTIMPFSSAQSEDPEDLWAALQAYETRTNGKALAIPHNANLSNGRMFAFTDFEGSPIDADYASRRARWEPLVEVTQIKGDSESHPFLSPNDEFASYGDAGWELGNLTVTGTHTQDMHGGDYVREALKRGFVIERDTGINPFKLGMIGSTDSHTALATADSDNYFGKHSGVEPGPLRAANKGSLAGSGLRVGWHYLASGYAAVWARENTREAIFDSMMRKEVYATTGPRITLRFFGGWDFSSQDARATDLAEVGYAKGVPMGGDLPPRKAGAPAFVVHALMDPEGANLDRVQIVKGWVDRDGRIHEQVHDVVWSGDRVAGADGKLPSVGSTVDLSVPTWRNSIGAPELKAQWSDPAFDPASPAFYYVRVIEIPTPRWPAYDAARFDAQVPADAQLSTQERAYSSPIWYSPQP